MVDCNMVTAFTESQAAFRSAPERASNADTYRDMMKKIMKSAKTETKDSAEQSETDAGTQEEGDTSAVPAENAAALIQADAQMNTLVWIQPPVTLAAGKADFVQQDDQTACRNVNENDIAGQQGIAAGTGSVSEENILTGKKADQSMTGGEQAFLVGMETAVKEENGVANRQAGISGKIPEKQAEPENADPAAKERTAVLVPEKMQDGQKGEKEALALQTAPEGAENLQPLQQNAQVQEAVPLSQDGGEENVLKLPEEIPLRLQAGEKEFSVQLEPENLGKLMIKASYQDGKAVVSIICTNEKTMELLSNRAGELGSLMEKSLGVPTEVYLDKSEQNYLNLAQDGRNGRQDDQGEKENKEGKHREKSERPDFLQQLRLGLV